MWSSLWIRHGEGVWLLCLHDWKKNQKRSHWCWSHLFPISAYLHSHPQWLYFLLTPISRGRFWEETLVELYCPCVASQEPMCLPWLLSSAFLFSLFFQRERGKDEGMETKIKPSLVFLKLEFISFARNDKTHRRPNAMSTSPPLINFTHTHTLPSFPTPQLWSQRMK